MKRISRSQRQIFLLHLAEALIDCPADKIEETISQSLEGLAKLARADRASLIIEKSGGQLASMVAEWQSKGRPKLRERLQNFDPGKFRYLFKLIQKRREIITISSRQSLPPQAKSERQFLEEVGIQSLLLAPLYHNHRVIGALGVSNQRKRAWSKETINLLQETAAIFARAFKRRQRGQTMATLIRIGEAAATTDDLESFLRIIHQSISQLLPANNFYLALHEPQKNLVYFPYFVDEKDPHPQPRVLGRGITEYVLRTGKPLLATKKDIEQLAAAGEIEIFGTVPFVWLGVPLKVSGQTIGVLALQSYDKNVTYTLEDEALLRLISDNIAVFIHQKRSEAELAAKEQFLRNIFSSIQDGLCVLDRDFNILSVNQAMEKWYSSALPLEGKKCYEAFHNRSEPCDLCPTKEALAHGLPSMEVVPLRQEGKTAGWLEVYAFPLLDSASGQTSGVIEYVRDITARKEAEDRLKESLREKDILLRELHHRVKNNMQVISSLLNLQANHIADPVAKEMFRETQRRIRSMALVHEQLYQSANLSQINFASYLAHLSSHLFQACGVSTHRVRLNLQTEELLLDVNTAIPLGMIFNELMTNSLKHAFPDNREGEIKVILRRYDRDQAFLEVADNGLGLPKGFKLEECKSLGLQIVQTLCHQIKARIELDQSEGTAFRIIFPCPHETTVK